MSYTVGELAKLAAVSVRTLHHYDEIGLLAPSDRTSAGYRLYGAVDAERLHRILVYRQLGFDLAGIAVILDSSADDIEHLRRQHALLNEQKVRLEDMIRGVETMMKAKKSGVNLTPDEMKEVFGSFDPEEHADEAEQKWGNTDAYRESQRRTKTYDKQKWLEIKAEAEQISTQLAKAMKDGHAATSEVAMDLAERHRRHISKWFYDCSYEIHQGLGEMYTADPRFAQNYDAVAPGLSAYIRDAITANADRASN
jgi:MerR family transcriptional regulator, thiopeptide resistance regulator